VINWKILASGLAISLTVLGLVHNDYSAQQIDPSTSLLQACDQNPEDGYKKSITGIIDGDPLELVISKRFAGAVESVTWRGKEFINIYDHGRQISYAWHMNGYSECFNPTEPGTAADYQKPTSSSQLLSACSEGTNKITTTTQLAYWLGPGESGFCSGGVSSAINDTVLSGHILEKTIEIGYQGMENVISFTAVVTLPEEYSSIQLEIPTGYLTYEFNNYWLYDPISDELIKPESFPLHAPWTFEHYGNLPPILATSDGEYAMGAYTAEQILDYGIFGTNSPIQSDRTNKWNMVIREEPASAQSYTYQSYAIVGTLAQVQETMKQLYKLHPTDLAPPTGFVDIADCNDIAGWAWDPKTPDQPIAVEFYALNDDETETLLIRIDANQYREDLASALGDNGNHGFYLSTSEIIHDNRRVDLKAYAINSNPKLPKRELNNAIQSLECAQFGPPLEPTITPEPTIPSEPTESMMPTAETESKPATPTSCFGTTVPLAIGLVTVARRRKKSILDMLR